MSCSSIAIIDHQWSNLYFVNSSLNSFYILYFTWLTSVLCFYLGKHHRVNLRFSFSRCFITFSFLILNKYVILCSKKQMTICCCFHHFYQEKVWAGFNRVKSMIRVIPPTTLSNLSNGQKQAALKIFTEPLCSLVLLPLYLKEEKEKRK